MIEETREKRIAAVDAKDNTVKGAGAVTGLGVQPGQTLTIWVDEDEAWEITPGSALGANGNPGKTVQHPTNGEFEYSSGAVVGSLDGGKTFFPVGGRLLMNVPCKGELTFYAWDDGPDDNKGEIEVVVGLQPYEDDEIRAARARAAGWSPFVVSADEHLSGGGKGLDTGVTVSPGDILRVVVSGADVWSTSGANLCSANGYGFFEGLPITLAVGGSKKFSFPRGALIGSLDGGKTFFFVGSQLELTALGAGRLTLYCADDDLSDNDLTAAASKRTVTAYVDVVKKGTYRGLLSR